LGAAGFNGNAWCSSLRMDTPDPMQIARSFTRTAMGFISIPTLPRKYNQNIVRRKLLRGKC